MLLLNAKDSYKSLVSLADIKSLEDIGNVDVIERSTKRLAQAILYKEIQESCATVYAVITEGKRHNVLGRITVVVITTLKCRSIVDIPDSDKNFYLTAAGLHPTLYVKSLFAPGKTVFSGIGSRLLQWAKAHSTALGCEGRLVLKAEMSSHGFYQKQKLRAMTGTGEMTAADVDKKICEMSPCTTILGPIYMYLPKENLQK